MTVFESRAGRDSVGLPRSLDDRVGTAFALGGLGAFGALGRRGVEDDGAEIEAGSAGGGGVDMARRWWTGGREGRMVSSSC